jgi:hypothetical protein
MIVRMRVKRVILSMIVRMKANQLKER